MGIPHIPVYEPDEARHRQRIAETLNRLKTVYESQQQQWSGTAPYVELYETDGTANKRRWRTSATGGKLTITYVKDDGTAATAGEVLSVDPAPTPLVSEQTLLRAGGTSSGVRIHSLAFSAGSDPADPVFTLDPNTGVAAYLGLPIVAFAESYALQTNYIGISHDGTNGTLDTTGALIITAGSYVRLGSSTGPLIRWGTGTPEGAVSAPVGSLFLRTDGGAGTTLYVKQSGTGNTGWAGK